ncbi:MAG: COG1361 S-layer family protein [Candidatus Nitrosotenuis sp.]
MKLAFALLTLVLLAPITGAYAQLGNGDSPFERNFGDVKFLDAYFGTIDNKVEVTPGDKNVPFTVVFANVGSQDITGIKGQLLMPMGFGSADGKGALIYADSDSEAEAGKHFSLTFFVNIDKNTSIQQFPATVKLDYSRLRESGARNSFFDFNFKVTGESILNLKADQPFLTSLKNNAVTVEITNTGTAPLANVKVILQNTQTSVSATSTSITNLENVVFDQNEWDIGTIDAQSAKKFTFTVYVPENVKTETLHTPLKVTYYNAHGDKTEDTRTVDFYINGLIDAKIYDIGVIDIAEKQTIIGDIINEGNINALFAFVTLEPLEGSNIKKTTQFIDELETDSPVPFNIPVEFDGEPKYGDHKIKITVRYKDDVRQEHTVSEIATVTLKDLTKKPEPKPEDFAPGIIALAIVGIIGYVAYKKIKQRKAKAESETH